MRIVIIEDEKLLQDELICQLKKLEQMEILHCIPSVSESVAWLPQNTDRIDLIFMDIELADGVCFEIFESLTITTPIIFLTAYSQYAIQAFKVNSIDYLLKPINPKDLSFAMDKFKAQKKRETTIDRNLLKDLYLGTKGQESQRILVQTGDHFRHIETQQIAYFIAEDKYTTVVTIENKKHLINESLTTLEQTLPTSIFHRPTRQHIVNINAIVKASKYFNSRLKLQLAPSPENDIIISRNKVKDFLNWMGA